MIITTTTAIIGLKREGEYTSPRLFISTSRGAKPCTRARRAPSFIFLDASISLGRNNAPRRYFLRAFSNWFWIVGEYRDSVLSDRRGALREQERAPFEGGKPYRAAARTRRGARRTCGYESLRNDDSPGSEVRMRSRRTVPIHGTAVRMEVTRSQAYLDE